MAATASSSKQNGFHSHNNSEQSFINEGIYADIRETAIGLSDSDPEEEVDPDPLEILETLEPAGGAGADEPDFMEEYLPPPQEHRIIGDVSMKEEKVHDSGIR